nr:hypothetical protein [Tanacetum cinerariifolium]
MLWGFYHRINIDFAYLIWEDFVYQVEHKNQKRSNEMNDPRFTKVIIDYFMTRKPSISRRNRINWHYVRDDALFSTIMVVSRHQTTQQYGAILSIELTTDEIRNSKAYKEYYACAMGEAAPKSKVSARKKKGDSASSTTPPTPTPTTTVASAPRLSATAKGKQPSRATTPTEPIDVQRTESEQLKIVLKRSRQVTHISQQHGSGTDKGTSSKPGVPDVPSDDSEEEISWNSSDDEDVGSHEEGNKFDESDDECDEGSDDDSDETVKAGAGKDDDDNDDEDDDDNDEEEELAKSDEEYTETGKGGDDVNESEGESEEEETRQEEEESFDPIPRTPKETPIPSTTIPSIILENLPTFNSAFRFEKRSRSLETSFSEYRQANPFVDAMSAIPGIVQQYMTQQMTEAALVEAYDADKAILDTYEDSTILKRRREDDDQEGPSAGSDRGSKRQKEGGEHASASTPSEKATEGAGRSTTGSQSRQLSASESVLAEEPVQTTCQMEEPPHSVFKTGADDPPRTLTTTTLTTKWTTIKTRTLTTTTLTTKWTTIKT